MLLCVSLHLLGNHRQSVRAVSLNQQQGGGPGARPKLHHAPPTTPSRNKKVGC